MSWTSEDEARARTRHPRHEGWRPFCGGCLDAWPCHVVRALDALDEAQRERDDATKTLNEHLYTVALIAAERDQLTRRVAELEAERLELIDGRAPEWIERLTTGDGSDFSQSINGVAWILRSYNRDRQECKQRVRELEARVRELEQPTLVSAAAVQLCRFCRVPVVLVPPEVYGASMWRCERCGTMVPREP